MDFPSYFFITSRGSKFRFRPVHPSDKELLQKGFSELSERSRYLRFFNSLHRLSDAHLRYLTHVDGEQHVAWGILDESAGQARPVGLGRFIQVRGEPKVAEVAITIVDAYQRQGLGQLLFATLNIIAGHKGIDVFRYYVHDANRFVLYALKQFETLKQQNESQVTQVDMRVLPNHLAISDQPNLQPFKAAMEKIEKAMFMEKK